MQTLLTQRRDPNVRAYWVWGPYLRNDTEKAARDNSLRYGAPNSVYFWTTTPKLATDLSSALHLPAGRLAWDIYLLYGRGKTWDSAFPQPRYWQHQLEILQGEPLDVNLLDARVIEALGGRSVR
jgi:hypothetical protein